MFSLLCAALAGTAAATYYPPILDPAPYTTWTGSYNGSKVAEVSVPFTNIDGEADSQDYARLDLVGDAAARGFAHGYLMHKDIEELTVHALPKFYRMQVQDLFDGLPSPIGKGLARAAVELGTFAPLPRRHWVGSPPAFSRPLDRPLTAPPRP